MSFDDLVAVTANGLGGWIALKNGKKVYQQGEETLGESQFFWHLPHSYCCFVRVHQGFAAFLEKRSKQ